MKFLQFIKSKLQKISIVDKTLMFIMVLTMLILSYSLFFPVGEFMEYGTINSVFRTSASAIFGYILSGNFGKKGEAVKRALPVMQILFTAGIGISCMITLMCLGFWGKIESVSTDDISTITMIRDFVSASTGFLIGSPDKD